MYRLVVSALCLVFCIDKDPDIPTAGPLSEQAEAALTEQPMSNTRRAADRDLGPMLPATKELLREFHQPFNQKLASVLDNENFLWESS